MPTGFRIFMIALGLATIYFGWKWVRIAEAWRRDERFRDEAKPFAEQERFTSFTRMHTVWNARLLSWSIVALGLLLVGLAVFGGA